MARGSIQQRSPGTWSIRVELPPDPGTNRRRQKRVTVRGTKREAEVELANLLHQLNTGSLINPGKITLGDFLNSWLRDYVETQVMVTTQQGYRTIIEKHLIPNLGSIPLAKLRPSHLQAYYAKALVDGHRLQKRGLSPQTLLHHHRCLSGALNHAVKWGFVSRNVALAVDPPRATHKEMHPLDWDGALRLLEASKESIYYPVIHLAVFSGLRRSEILGLRWRDLSIERSVVTVMQALHVLPGGRVIFQEPKTERSRRTVTLSESAILVLKGHRERTESTRAALGMPISEDTLVFTNPDGGPILPNTLTHAFRRIASRAGLDISFHGLRHTHVSLLIRQGIQARYIAGRVGHATTGMTNDVYGHLMIEGQREAADKFEEGMGSSHKGG